MFLPGQFSFDWAISDEEVEEALDEIKKMEKSDRKDYCHDCQNSKLYWQAMAARCSSCDKIILGGDNG